MKKSTRNILIFLAGVVAAFVVIFLFRTFNSSEEEKMTAPPIQEEDLLEEIEAEAVEANDELPDSFLAANTEFSFDLFKQLAAEKNPVYSPVPVSFSLALLSNGAVDEAQKEILETLHGSEFTQEEFNHHYYELAKQLEMDEATTVTIENSIWHNQDFEANLDFLTTNKTYYNVNTFTLDFGHQQAPDEMNQWIKDATHGKIPKIIDEISEEAVMYLFSTIFFDGEWETPFAAEDTYESEFLVDGEILDIEKMTGRFEMDHLSTEEEEGIILPYEDGQYSFVALMPNREITIREYLEEIDQEKISELFNQIEKNEIDLLLPKFEVSFENQLDKTLLELGIKEIFTPEMNSLRKIGETTGNLFVSEMLQKTTIEVNELGTEAASAVSSSIEVTSMPEPKPMIDFNRPFLYSIVNDETGSPIFLGIMDHPEQ